MVIHVHVASEQDNKAISVLIFALKHTYTYTCIHTQ